MSNLDPTVTPSDQNLPSEERPDQPAELAATPADLDSPASSQNYELAHFDPQYDPGSSLPSDSEAVETPNAKEATDEFTEEFAEEITEVSAEVDAEESEEVVTETTGDISGPDLLVGASFDQDSVSEAMAAAGLVAADQLSAAFPEPLPVLDEDPVLGEMLMGDLRASVRFRRHLMIQAVLIILVAAVAAAAFALSASGNLSL